jgi:hypothetical protein
MSRLQRHRARGDPRIPWCTRCHLDAGRRICADRRLRFGRYARTGCWQAGYKRQMKVYRWLLRQDGFAVSETGYYVCGNGRADREAFDERLKFEVKVIANNGHDALAARPRLRPIGRRGFARRAARMGRPTAGSCTGRMLLPFNLGSPVMRKP